MSNSTALARGIIKQLIELGIKDVVLSPGSRNAPLSIALYEASEKGMINLHVRIDERGAAFFALGIAKASARYVPVVCTSGTAVANYYPAVLEAHHSDVNLLLLTADRPARLRRTGVNQTTDQNKIFGTFVRASFDTDKNLDLSKVLSGSGPVHVNLQFDEPLLPKDSSEWLSSIKPIDKVQQTKVVDSLVVSTRRNLVLVGHDRAGFSIEEIKNFTNQLAACLITEDPLVFEQAVAHIPIILSDVRLRVKLTPELVVIFGRPNLDRSTDTFIQGAGRVIVIDPRTKRIDTERNADETYHAIPLVVRKVGIDQSWHDEWHRYEKLASESLESLPDWSESVLASVLSRELRRDSAFFISSSRPIRDVQSFAIPRSGLHTFANRGLAGIDGSISTAMGIAIGYQRTYAMIGDIAFLHDISALVNPITKSLVIVVIDNNGGGIFSTLPQKDVVGFEKIFGTPHGLDISNIVSAFGVSCEEVRSTRQLIKALRRNYSNMHVIIAKMPNRIFLNKQTNEVLEGFINKVSKESHF